MRLPRYLQLSLRRLGVIWRGGTRAGVAAIVLGVAVVTLVGCGGSSDDETAGTDSPTEALEPAAEATEIAPPTAVSRQSTVAPTAAPTETPPPPTATTEPTAVPAATRVPPTAAPPSATPPPPTPTVVDWFVDFYPDNRVFQIPEDQQCVAINWQSQGVTDLALERAGMGRKTVEANGREENICFGEDEVTYHLYFKPPGGEEQSRSVRIERD